MPQVKDLVRIVYVSRATRDMPLDKVLSLIAKARTANKARGLTGALLFDKGIFLQFLEGPAETLDPTVKAILGDPRHTDVRILLRETIRSRLFADWSMGHADATLEDLDRLPGLNGFFQSGKTAYDMGHPQLEAIIDAFRKGTLASERISQANSA